MAWTPPRTWIPYELVTDTMLNVHVRDNLNYLLAAVNSLNPQDWMAYLPQWATSGSPQPTNGSVNGRYYRVGNLCTVQISLKMTSSSTLGTGVFLLSLPFPRSDAVIVPSFGALVCQDTSTSLDYLGVGVVFSATQITFIADTGSGHGYVSAVVPFAWADNDYLFFQGTYVIQPGF